MKVAVGASTRPRQNDEPPSADRETMYDAAEDDDGQSTTTEAPLAVARQDATGVGAAGAVSTRDVQSVGSLSEPVADRLRTEYW